MQLKQFTVVGVVFTLCLLTFSFCHYIPDRKVNHTDKKNETSNNSLQIQICGNELTNFILEACDGIVGSLNQVNLSKGSTQTKITEDCCNHKCTLDYLQNYCGETPLFNIKKLFRGKLFDRLSNRSQEMEGKNGRNGKAVLKKKAERENEVRNKKRKLKKKKRSFKWKCAYKSFGHFLLTNDRFNKNSTNNSKRQNSINRSWPSLQVGTISPEIDKFGGRPTVVVKKNKSNFI